MKYLIAPLCALCLLAGVAAAPARAQHTAILSNIHHRSLSLPAAIELALRANPEVLMAGREVEALEGEASQAGQSPNPAIDILREGLGQADGATTVQLSIPIELGGKRAARRRLAGLALEQGRQQLAITRARVRAETIAAYAELHLAGERVGLVQAGAGLAAASRATAERRVAAGKLSPVEASRARVAQAGVRIELLQAERDLELARQRLRALLPPDAVAFDTVANPDTALPPLPDLGELMGNLDRLPALAQARLEVARRAALSQVELARRVPDLTLVVGSKRERTAGEGDSRRLLVLGLSVPLPLFDRNTGAVLAALRRIDKARDEETAEAARLRLELGQAHARLATALREVALIDSEILPGARGAFDAASRGFEAGKFSYLEVLDAQRTLLQSRQQIIKASGEAHRAAADIAALTGSSL